MDAVAVTHAQLPLTYRINPEWETTILEQARDRDYIVIEPGTDPREAYINYIFHPGQFSLADITKALSIYRRSNVKREGVYGRRGRDADGSDGLCDYG